MANEIAHPQARRAADAIPDEALDEFTIAGTPEECRAKLDEYAAMGTEHSERVRARPKSR